VFSTSCIPIPFQLLLTTPEGKAYIPMPKFPESIVQMSRGAVLQIIKDITAAKIVLEDGEGNAELLPAFVYSFMLRKYGLIKMVERHIVEFLAACVKYKLTAPRIMMFCRFLSLKGSDPLSAAAFEFVLTVVRTVNALRPSLADRYLEREEKKLLLNTTISQQLIRGGGAETWVSADRVASAFKLLFRDKDAVVQDAIRMVDAQSELEGAGHSFSFMKITMQCVEGIAVACWESLGGDAPADLEVMFVQADENKDGVLSYEEFAKLMGQIKPDLGLVKSLQIFREAVAESSSQSGDVITPDAFARVMSSHNISTVTDVHRGQLPVETAPRRVSYVKTAFTVDFVLLPTGFMDQFFISLTKIFQAYCQVVSTTVEEYEVEGRMSLKDWLAFCADSGIVGGPPAGLNKAKAGAVFRESNGDRYVASDTGERTVQTDHDADSMTYDEFKYGLAMVAHLLYHDMPELGQKINTLIDERIKTM